MDNKSKKTALKFLLGKINFLKPQKTPLKPQICRYHINKRKKLGYFNGRINLKNTTKNCKILDVGLVYYIFTGGHF